MMSVKMAIRVLKNENLADYELEEDCYCVICESIRMKEVRKLLEKEGKVRGKIASIL